MYKGCTDAVLLFVNTATGDYQTQGYNSYPSVLFTCHQTLTQWLTALCTAKKQSLFAV